MSKLSTLARVFVSALALTAVGCSDADTEEDATESAEAELTGTSRAFVGQYRRFGRGTDYLDYAALDLRGRLWELGPLRGRGPIWRSRVR
ncbi:MAG: hypothetical protein IPG50_11840 [Myxococcales bacterium]|nr:hypothetical protein [Myxococcales bacterium]